MTCNSALLSQANINSLDDLSHNLPVGCSQFMKRLNELSSFEFVQHVQYFPFYDRLNDVEDFCLYFTDEEIEGLHSLAFV